MSMGLDVNLYHCTKPYDEVVRLREEGRRKAKEVEAASLQELGAKSFDGLAEGQYDTYFAKTRAQLAAAGFDEDGDPLDAEEGVARDSSVYPDHYFKIGYLRSSYNESGINNVLRKRIGKTLHDIFPSAKEDDGDYYRRVDWPAALVRAREVRDEFATFIAKHGAFNIREETHNPFIPAKDLPSDEKAALELFLREHAKWKEREGKPDMWDKGKPCTGSAYSSGLGEFRFGDAVEELVAVMPGASEGWASKGKLRPVFYIVTQPRKDAEPWHPWYSHALEITVEMCEWVLSQPDPERYILHWSG